MTIDRKHGHYGVFLMMLGCGLSIHSEPEEDERTERDTDKIRM